MKVTIDSVGFSADFRTCMIDIDASTLPRRSLEPVVHVNGHRVLRVEVPVSRGRMPSKARIESAVRDAVRGYMKEVANDQRCRAMLERGAAYRGTVVEVRS